MTQLEEANKKVKLAQAASASDAPSPSSTADFSFMTMSDSRLMSPELDAAAAAAPEATRTRADVQDWIAKARESIQAFDGYINMGGPSVRRGDLVADEEGSDPENDFVGQHDEEDDVSVSVEDVDGEEDASEEDRTAEYRRMSSNSEARPKKERLATIATIPSPAAPFGLMAKMSLGNSPGLRRMKSKSSVGAEEEEDEDVGLANPDFFRASEYSVRCHSMQCLAM